MTVKSKPWHPVIASGGLRKRDEPQPFSFSKQQENEILHICKVSKHSDSKQFLQNIRQATANFVDFRRQASNSKPANIRNRLKKVRDCAAELADAINDFDLTTIRLLENHGLANDSPWVSKTFEDGKKGYERSCPAPLRIISDHLDRLQKASKDALLEAKDFKGGRLPKHAESFLAARIARMLQDDLGINPTASRDGLFANLLGFVLIAASRQGKCDVRLLKDAIARAKDTAVLPGGVVVIPPSASHRRKNK